MLIAGEISARPDSQPTSRFLQVLLKLKLNKQKKKETPQVNFTRLTTPFASVPCAGQFFKQFLGSYRSAGLNISEISRTDLNLGLQNVTDPILSITELKYKPEFAGFIRDIGMDKFYVMYCSNKQIFLYKTFNKNRFNSTGALSIDATGSLIKHIIRPDGSSNVIYLYRVARALLLFMKKYCQYAK